MKPACFVFLFLFIAATLFTQSNPIRFINQAARVASPTAETHADPKAQAQIVESYGKLPLSFEANQGQTDARVKFLSRGSGYTLFLTSDEAVFSLRGRKTDSVALGRPPQLQLRAVVPRTNAVVRMKLVNANRAAKVTGTNELPGKSNYFIGNDRKKWRSHVPTYARVKYENVYPGIDLVYYGNQRQLEYDFIVAPGANPHCIAFDVRGAKRIRRDEHGDLLVKVGEDEIRWHKPAVYQEKDGKRQEIKARYAITDKDRVGFTVAKYDTNRPLYIDPLIYSTYLGGSGTDYGFAIAVDSSGNAYITGRTNSTNFPTVNPLQPTYGGGVLDAFVAKINSTGSALVYSTYLGGVGEAGGFGEEGFGIAVDGAGNAYVTGATSSTDFPVTAGAFQTACGGSCKGNAFVTKLNPTGSALVYSTYLGGSGTLGDTGDGIAVDSAGNAYVTGTVSSVDFPVTPNAFQLVFAGGNYDAFVTKFDPTGSALVYSTYLGGSSDADFGKGIAVDSAGNAYVTGQTGSTDFPTMNPLQPTNAGSTDAFVTKFDHTGSAVYSTYLGGSSDDFGYSIAVDNAGDAYVTGATYSTDFPTMNSLQAANAGGPDAFVAKLNASGSALVYSTYLGGSGADAGYGIAVDSAGNAYVTGQCGSTDFPTMNPLQPAYGGGGYDAFVSEVNALGLTLVYSTYLGGSNIDDGYSIAVDSAGNAYVTGYTESTDFPTMNPLQPTNGGGTDGFVAKIGRTLSSITTIASSSNPSVLGQSVTFTATVTSQGSGQASGTPTGTVTFTYGSTTLCNAVTLVGGVATCTYSSLPAGADTVTSSYSGDANFTPSSGTVSQTVNKATTTTTVTSSLTPSTFNQQVTFTATVTGQFGGTPTGTVTFSDGTTTLGTSPLSGGMATFSTATLAAGLHSINAVYSGDSNFLGGLGSINQTVNQASTTVALGSSVNPSGFGQPVTFTATISPQYGDQASGTITFKDGSTTLGSSTVSGNVASLTTSGLAIGRHSITAIYSGNSNFMGSTSPALSQVVQGPTVTLSPTSLTFPTQVVFTASKAKVVTLKNTGLGILNITSIATAAPFARTNTCGTTVNPGASCTISVTFKPTTIGTLTGSVSVTDNAPGSPQKLALKGTGTYIQLTPASVNFGNQPVGSKSLPKTITLTNKGSVTVNVTGISFTGTNATDFAQTNTCGTNVAKGASCFIKVTFTPGATGTRTAQVSISDNGGGSPQKVGLIGTGTP
jgi:hypothetical protein